MEEDYRMDDEGEEDVMGLFATNANDDDFIPSSGMGKGKCKSPMVAMDGVVESVRASSSTRVQRKRRRKPLPDELETEYRIKHDDDDDGSTKATKPTRVRAQYPRLRLFSMPIPRNAVG